MAQALAQAGRKTGISVPVHLKVETGIYRQGLPLKQVLDLAKLVKDLDGIRLEGLTTHYADIDNCADRSFAHHQLAQLKAAEAAFQQIGLDVPMVHSANSAATILWPETHGSMVRVGIANYGLWPSIETYATILRTATDQKSELILNLCPVLSWRTHVVQVKDIPTGSYVGYGRTYRATCPMRLAILPLGYHEGYDRRLSNLGYVLIHGVRAPICGRVFMNMTVVDVTHIPGVQVGTVATLLGTDGEEKISAEQIASWIGTINYEVVCRIHPSLPRFTIYEELRYSQNKVNNTVLVRK